VHQVGFLHTDSIEMHGQQNIKLYSTVKDWGTRWRNWLTHCATNRKIAVYIPDGVIENFR